MGNKTKRPLWRMIEVRDGGVHAVAVAVTTTVDPSPRNNYRLPEPGERPKKGDRLLKDGTIMDGEEYERRMCKHLRPRGERRA